MNTFVDIFYCGSRWANKQNTGPSNAPRAKSSGKRQRWREILSIITMKSIMTTTRTMILLQQLRYGSMGFAPNTIKRPIYISTRVFSEQPIVWFQKDEEDHWVAQLACGHFQHVRHNPPMVERPWVLTEEGRDSFLGHKLLCKKCDISAQKDALPVNTDKGKWFFIHVRHTM